MKLIDADALKEDIERLKQNLEKWVAHTECDTTKALVRISLYEEFIDLIDNAPTVNLEKTSFMKGYNYGCDDGKRFYERPHGKWQEDKHEYFQVCCSVCKGINKYTTNFCPNCGADMQKGGNNE